MPNRAEGGISNPEGDINKTDKSIEQVSKRVIKVLRKKEITEPVKIEMVETPKETQSPQEWSADFRALVKLKQGKVDSMTAEEMAERDEKSKREARRILGGE